MNILIIGLGVIGTTYGYLFQKANHNVEHYIRKDSPNNFVSELDIQLLDGRIDPKGVLITDRYRVNHCKNKQYDIIFVSVPSGGIERVIKCLKNDKITGTIILCCGIWEDKNYLNKTMEDQSYILGYPVAGGNISEGSLQACVFDHFMLENEKSSNIQNYNDVISTFNGCNIKLEQPYDMLEWIWLHMAINAAVVSVAGSYGDINNTSLSAEKLMESPQMLAKAINAIRETSKIIESRNVNLKNYNNELLVYTLPTFVSSHLMKRMFANNILTRKIMTLHGNINDLIFVCKSLYDTGRAKRISAPIFYSCCEDILKRFESADKK